MVTDENQKIEVSFILELCLLADCFLKCRLQMELI